MQGSQSRRNRCGSSSSCRSLNLSYNQLTLPESLGQLTHLHLLNVSRNQLTTLPKSLGQLVELKTLYAGHNQLTTLPESLDQLTQLRELSLYVNQLTALPGTVLI